MDVFANAATPYASKHSNFPALSLPDSYSQTGKFPKNSLHSCISIICEYALTAFCFPSRRPIFAVWPSKYNLVPRVSSLLYLYSGIQEAVQQSDWLLTILRRNSFLRWVKDLCMSKFDAKLHSLPIPTIICKLFPKFEE